MKQSTGQNVRRIGYSLSALSILVTLLSVANWAQQPTALSSRSVYNDTFAQTFAQVEAFFDNVVINVSLPPEKIAEMR